MRLFKWSVIKDGLFISSFAIADCSFLDLMCIVRFLIDKRKDFM